MLEKKFLQICHNEIDITLMFSGIDENINFDRKNNLKKMHSWDFDSSLLEAFNFL